MKSISASPELSRKPPRTPRTPKQTHKNPPPSSRQLPLPELYHPCNADTECVVVVTSLTMHSLRFKITLALVRAGEEHVLSTNDMLWTACQSLRQPVEAMLQLHRARGWPGTSDDVRIKYRGHQFAPRIIDARLGLLFLAGFLENEHGLLTIICPMLE